MTTAHIVDSGVFIRCGGPNGAKYRRLRRAVRTADITCYIPQRVYEELGGAPDAYPSSTIRWQEGIDEGWIVVADPLEYSNPIVSGIMDATRRFIANETDRSEDVIEKADTALVGLAAQFLENEAADRIVLLTTDKPAVGRQKRSFPSTDFTIASSIDT